MVDRYLWSHESTMNISVGEVYSQINRPDLRPTDLAYLNISLSSTAGNISNWVDFLANGEFSSSHFICHNLQRVAIPALPSLKCCRILHLSSTNYSAESCATGRPRMHKVWETTMNSFDLDAMLYPVFATSPRCVAANSYSLWWEVYINIC